MNTLDNFVKKMSTPQTRANTKKTDKTGSEKTPEKIPEKNKKKMSEVSRSLRLIQSDLAEVKTELKKTITDDKLESLVSSIVKKIIEQNNKEIENKIKEETNKRCLVLEKQYNAKIDNMKNDIEKLEQNVETLTEKLVDSNKEVRELKQVLQKTEHISKEAMRLANQNEQYSRKHNFKIMGLTENDNENTWKLVQDFLKTNINVEIDDREIIAAHRIPGKRGKPRPIIVKLLNTNSKSKVMRKRSEIRKRGQGIKLVDDVTRPNSELITTLINHDDIASAWYFNGSVFGKLKSNERHVKFDIFDEIDEKVKCFMK